MVILVLGLILLGSFSTATFLLVQGMSWGMIVLGYVAGGWAGLILGLPLLYLLHRLAGSRHAEMAFDLHKQQSQP